MTTDFLAEKIDMLSTCQIVKFTILMKVFKIYFDSI